jgi:hypothetical protein
MGQDIEVPVEVPVVASDGQQGDGKPSSSSSITKEAAADKGGKGKVPKLDKTPVGAYFRLFR